jgi:hypothetical protein
MKGRELILHGYIHDATGVSKPALHEAHRSGRI